MSGNQPTSRRPAEGIDAAPATAGGDPLQRRVVRILAAAQILGGIGMGATLSLGALLASEISGSTAWSGMAATMSTLGAAVLAVPLARLAQARGRGISLSSGALIAGTGAVLAIVAAGLSSFPLLLLALMLLGAGSATNLQARFAATDLASTGTRGRDLSLVVWFTTIGAVLGPNLFEPGEALGALPLDCPRCLEPSRFPLPPRWRRLSYTGWACARIPC
jgi:MFS family permease